LVSRGKLASFPVATTGDRFSVTKTRKPKRLNDLRELSCCRQKSTSRQRQAWRVSGAFCHWRRSMPWKLPSGKRLPTPLGSHVARRDSSCETFGLLDSFQRFPKVQKSLAFARRERSCRLDFYRGKSSQCPAQRADFWTVLIGAPRGPCKSQKYVRSFSLTAARLTRLQPPAPPGGSTPRDDAYRDGNRPPGGARG
jgi:hypothetical protein